MWRHVCEELEGGRVRRLELFDDDDPLSYKRTLGLLQHDEGFQNYFIDSLAASPFEAYFWETPPVTAASAERPFEFVLVDSPTLARVAADPDAFREYFDTNELAIEIAGFYNLGRDAYLVAPAPHEGHRDYSHLAAFSRDAPRSQQQALWSAVGAAAEQRIGEKPMWLSTSGLGVYWLHVRLDTYPKYYTYDPYRNA